MKEIIKWFFLEQSSQNIAFRKSIKLLRVIRSLTIITRALTKEVPGIFSGTVEVDETYLGGQWKTNERLYGIKKRNGERDQEATGLRNPLSETELFGLNLLIM
jgi:hypothetical protein